ncbi:HK97 family phage prohead protease [Sansalvadorimonas verongulae]|uniref:HK97 family phage prohead protease n=1 Tax=Sansalvadorimonas verongulae TaxID=2172824 RepID=UPI002E35B6AD|nr:HK97 family phage prohead protease [Sansalvadorimonas verongulae]MTI12046.1 HK97 family phage prohead protease [Sansalvadorimonas verongulae]
MSDIEKRTFACELRAAMDGDTPKIDGYGAVFNSRSENLGGFREIIMPGAFDSVLDDDVRALFNHDPNFVLGRSSAGTLELSTDDKGLRYLIDAPNTQTIRDLVLEPMKRGDISQSSFAFRVARNGEEWEEDEDGVIVRTIHKMQRLFDVSPVTYPAYTDAGAATRSLKAWQEAREQGVLKQAISQRQARERLLDLIGA